MATDVRDSEDLSTIERLILAQAVYEHGADAWQSVSKVLANHPALARPEPFFTPQFCHQIYVRLMNEASLECSDANNSPHALLNLRLAQRHYSSRLLYLRDLIAAEEVKFKSLVAEIGEIRSGAWDDKIKAKLAGNLDNQNSDVTVAADTRPPAVARGQDNADGQSLVADVEPQQSVAEELTTTDGHGISTQNPEDDTKIHVVDDAIQQPFVALSPDTPADSQITEAVSVAEDVVPETAPAPADIVEISEELTTIDISEASKPASEPARMDVEEPSILPDPECKTSEKEQQREGKRKVADSDNLDECREKKRTRDESTPPDADEQAYPSRRGTANGEPASHQQTPPSVPNKRFQAVIGMLHSQISQHRNGNIFHNPIKNSEAPDYHDIIKRPMDLKTIKARVKDGVISNSLEFQRDVYLMFANAMMYNRRGSDIYHMAEEMMLESEVHINTFRQTEGFIRSTRS